MRRKAASRAAGGPHSLDILRRRIGQRRIGRPDSALDQGAKRLTATAAEQSESWTASSRSDLSRAFHPIFTRELLESSQLLGLVLGLDNPIRARLLIKTASNDRAQQLVAFWPQSDSTFPARWPLASSNAAPKPLLLTRPGMQPLLPSVSLSIWPVTR